MLAKKGKPGEDSVNRAVRRKTDVQFAQLSDFTWARVASGLSCES